MLPTFSCFIIFGVQPKNMNDKNLSIMLIDDDEDDRELFQEALRELENAIDFTGAESCNEALFVLESKAVEPDFIFLDLNMPQIGGRECLTKLKNSLELSKIPVIMFSTSSDPRDIKETRDLGAIDFITKPPRTSELVTILKKFIAKNAELSNKK